MIVDIFAHHVPQSVGEMIKKAGFFKQGDDQINHYQGKNAPAVYPLNNSDPETRLALMDKYGIDVQALSQTTPVLLNSSATEAAKLCRLSNDANYALCKAYPHNFVNICIISLLSIKSALKEMERASGELDCRAVTFSTNQKGKGIESPDYYPIYEILEKNDLPLILQPTNWESYPLVNGTKGLGTMLAIGWPFDTTQAVLRLILGGVLDTFPSLKIVTHHCGAMIPFFARRLEGTLFKRTKKPVSEYWENIYGDTAVNGSVAACMCGYAFFGSERMMFGTDYPFGSSSTVADTLASVKAMNIPAHDKKKILGANAQRLLKIS